MISIIICSRTPKLPQSLVENIESTIGCAYEWVVIDNSENRYSIFEAYNLGIQKSKGDYLCFVHDDVLFHTKGWGDIIFEVFESDEKIGLVGVAGAKVKTKMPSAWWDCQDSCKRMNLIQHFANGEIKDLQIGWQTDVLEEVVVIDGVFMVTRSNDGVRFNEQFIGFHNYDLNLSFEYIKKGFKVMVSKEILIEHFSIGKLDVSWYNSTYKIHKMYSNLLPLTTLEEYDFKRQEFKNGSRFVNDLPGHKMFKEAIFVWFKLIWFKPISKFHFQFFNKLKNKWI